MSMDKMTKQIPPGYKKTEIGIIPEDWEVKRLGEIFSILKTASFSKSDLSSKGHILYIHYGDIHTKWVHFLDLKKEDLPHIEHSKSRNYPLVKEGDLIMVDASEDYEGIGKSVETKNVGNKKVISGLHTLLLRDSQGKFVNGFKGFVTHNRIVKKQIEILATGLKVYGISKQNLKDVLIPIPPLPEQRAIARVLSDIDHLIESLDKLIEKKKLIKRGAMQLLLTGKKRLPGFQGEWVRKRLGEVFEIKRGASPRPINRYTTRNGINWIKISDVGNNEKYITKTEIKITNDGAEKSVFVHPNDLLLSNSMSYGRPYISRITGCIHDGWLLLKPKVKLDTEFMYYILRTNEIQKKFNLMAAGSGVNNLKIDSVSIVNVKIPPTPEEQGAIAKILSDMDAEIEALERKKEKYEMMKKGAMELLLTGKIRLKDHINEVLT